MNQYFTEVIDAHVAIENWLEKGAEMNRSCWHVLIPPSA
jgi:hypothetical protein